MNIESRKKAWGGTHAFTGRESEGVSKEKVVSIPALEGEAVP
jgi:hypothetical protein